MSRTGRNLRVLYKEHTCHNFFFNKGTNNFIIPSEMSPVDVIDSSTNIIPFLTRVKTYVLV